MLMFIVLRSNVRVIEQVDLPLGQNIRIGKNKTSRLSKFSQLKLNFTYIRLEKLKQYASVSMLYTRQSFIG
jgi:hypothetical protein